MRSTNALQNKCVPRSTVCDCCGEADKTGRALAWDHDHASGAFRGWLCLRCNLVLGHIADDISTLRCLIAYLERTTHRARERYERHAEQLQVADVL